MAISCGTCLNWRENQPPSELDVELGLTVHELDTLGWGKCALTESFMGRLDERPAIAIDSEAHHAICLLVAPLVAMNTYPKKKVPSHDRYL